MLSFMKYLFSAKPRKTYPDYEWLHNMRMLDFRIWLANDLLRQAEKFSDPRMRKRLEDIADDDLREIKAELVMMEQKGYRSVRQA